jgi:hypothetical protein
MKKNRHYLGYYYQWIERGHMSSRGLCTSLNWPDELDLFRPIPVGYFTYWAGPNDGSFTPLRQNIVLFLAAMNGEMD